MKRVITYAGIATLCIATLFACIKNEDSLDIRGINTESAPTTIILNTMEEHEWNGVKLYFYAEPGISYNSIVNIESIKEMAIKAKNGWYKSEYNDYVIFFSGKDYVLRILG